MFFKSKSEYINQSKQDTYTCQYLALINAYIDSKNKYPNEVPKYNTQRYFRFINNLKGENQNEKCDNLAEILGMRRIKLKDRFPDKDSFIKIKAFIIEHLKKDVLFDMTIWSGNLHSALIVDWNENKNSFHFVNAGFFSDSASEWLPLEIVYSCLPKKSTVNPKVVNYNMPHSYSQAKDKCRYGFLMDSHLILT